LFAHQSCGLFACNKEAGRPYLGLTGFYVKPSETGIGQVSDSWQYAVNGSTAFSKPFDPSHDIEGEIILGYHLPCSADNIEARYFHLDNHTHALNESTGATSFGSVFFNLSVPNPNFVSDANLVYKLDQVDLKFGRTYHEGSGKFSFKPTVGMRYTKIDHQLLFLVGKVKSHFSGFGPIFGVDSSYNLWRCFNFVGNFEYSPIVGKINSSSHLRFATNEVFTSPKIDRIVHNVKGNLGLNYRYTFCNDTTATLEGGYQVGEYINGIDLILAQSSALGAGQKINDIATNSFSYRGPYVNLTVAL
ncbi:MAG TPA: Lpg1974 family pore-forming outer membrane protein, partial [Candidatus Berkiella sp.]|nr:Lpg1974 family pore-forming outer membrane protein [Candidatus Berkiella sp.]